MRHILIVALLIVVMVQTINLSSLVHPVQSLSTSINPLQEAAIREGLGDPGEKILNAVSVASKQTKLSEPLLLSLMHSESSFDTRAVSSKNYQGLMQIPQKVPWVDVNVLIGARILLEKLTATRGNVRAAIVLYKGWPLSSAEGNRQASKVIDLANKLREI
jgi:Transglycosylase SLT domain.